MSVFSHGPFLLLKWFNLTFVSDLLLLLVIFLSKKCLTIKKNDMIVYICLVGYSTGFLVKGLYTSFVGLLFAIFLMVIIQNLSVRTFNRICDLYIYIWLFLSLQIFVLYILLVTNVININKVFYMGHNNMSELSIYFGSVLNGGDLPFLSRPLRFTSYFPEPSATVVYIIMSLLMALYRQKYVALVIVFIASIVFIQSFSLYFFLGIFFCFILSCKLLNNVRLVYVGLIFFGLLLIFSNLADDIVRSANLIFNQKSSGIIRLEASVKGFSDISLFGSGLLKPVGMIFDLSYIGLIPMTCLMFVLMRNFCIYRMAYDCAVYSFFLSILMIQYYGLQSFALVIFLGLFHKISKLSRPVSH